MFQGESRNAAIVRLHSQSFTYRQIKSALKVGSSTISSVISYYQKYHQIPQEPKQGCPTKINTTLLTLFVKNQTYENRRMSCQRVSDLWNTEYGKDYFNISKTSIYRIRRQLKFNYKSPKIRQQLTDKQIDNRNIFSHSLLQSNIDLSTIIFSDESRICLGPDSRYIWYQLGEVCDSVYQEYQKAELGVMVWGAIGLDFKSELIICPKTVDARAYRQVIRDSHMVELLNEKHGEGNWVFMQDGAPPHTAKDTKRFLLKRMNLLANWPANSPDMNPIEHLWAILKYRMREENPKTVNDLIRVLKSEWNSISMDCINNLVMSFRKRLLLVAKQKGKQIGDLIDKYSEDDIEFEEMSDPIECIATQCKEIHDIDDTPKVPFSLEEDQKLLELYTKIGPKWALIAKVFNGRKSFELRRRFVSIRGKEALQRKNRVIESNGVSEIVEQGEQTTSESDEDLFEWYMEVMNEETTRNVEPVAPIIEIIDNSVLNAETIEDQ